MSLRIGSHAFRSRSLSGHATAPSQSLPHQHAPNSSMRASVTRFTLPSNDIPFCSPDVPAPTRPRLLLRANTQLDCLSAVAGNLPAFPFHHHLRKDGGEDFVRGCSNPTPAHSFITPASKLPAPPIGGKMREGIIIKQNDRPTCVWLQRLLESHHRSGSVILPLWQAESDPHAVANKQALSRQR